MTEPEEDFAAMFEASLKAKRFGRGDTVEGTIVAIGPDVAFVNVGGKGEAVIELDELKNEDGSVEAAVGDVVQAVVVSTEGGLTLSRRLARNAASAREIADAFDAGLPVEGRVEQEVKGGYEVRIARQRAFCPASQIDIVRNTTAADHVGRVYTFRIMEYREGGRNIIVSRRALQEQEQESRAAEIRKSVVPGAVLAGRVVSVREFGAFVDLGAGVQGLLHVSEMAWSRVSAAQVVTEGQEITVKVLRVDEETQKIALGLKQLTADPWSTVHLRYEVGQVHQGRVTRLAEFGAFVELEPGVEGLAHSSTFPPTGQAGGWARTVPVGMEAPFEILSIDLEKKRIGVALVPEGSTRADGTAGEKVEIAAGARLVGKVERLEKFGVFVFLGSGRVGLIPLAETGVDKEADVAKAFPVGSDVEVIVLEVEAGGRRIRLSRKAVLQAQETQELREYESRANPAPAKGLGSFGDKLRDALQPRKK